MPPDRPKLAALSRRPTAEEAELFRRRSQLNAIRATVAAREAALADLRARLNSFEARYIRQVGVLYIQLDEWEDRIAELNSPLQIPEGAEKLDPAPDRALPTADPGPQATPAALDLKALFREVAKRIHPDFARDHHDEHLRTRLMAQANDAYSRDDAAILLRMLNGHDPSAEPCDLAAQLASILLQITQSETDLEMVNAEFDALAQSEMAQLYQRTTLAAVSGRDLLAELAARVKGSIGIAMRRYELDLGRARRKQAPFNPAPFLSAETADPEPAKVRPHKR